MKGLVYEEFDNGNLIMNFSYQKGLTMLNTCADVNIHDFVLSYLSLYIIVVQAETAIQSTLPCLHCDLIMSKRLLQKMNIWVILNNNWCTKTQLDLITKGDMKNACITLQTTIVVLDLEPTHTCSLSFIRHRLREITICLF